MPGGGNSEEYIWSVFVPHKDCFGLAIVRASYSRERSPGWCFLNGTCLVFLVSHH